MTSYKKLILKNTLTICVVFSLFFLTSFYIERYYSSKREYLAETQKKVDNLISRFDNASFQVQDLSALFRSNPDFKSYVESPSPNSYYNRTIATYIRSTIASLSGSDNFVAVTRPDDEFVLSVRTAATADNFLRSYGTKSTSRSSPL